MKNKSCQKANYTGFLLKNHDELENDVVFIYPDVKKLKKTSSIKL
jgi:hypothetical protein